MQALLHPPSQSGLTFFASTDAAFRMLRSVTGRYGNDAKAMLFRHTAELAEILSSHVIAGRHLIHDLVESKAVTTLSGARLVLSSSSAGVCVEHEGSDVSGTVTLPDVQVNNGVVHWIDALLLPPDPCSKHSFEGLGKSHGVALFVNARDRPSIKPHTADPASSRIPLTQHQTAYPQVDACLPLSGSFVVCVGCHEHASTFRVATHLPRSSSKSAWPTRSASYTLSAYSLRLRTRPSGQPMEQWLAHSNQPC